jgi:hypothetical protein
MLKLVSERSPELLKPSVAVKIEEVLTQKAPGLSIDDRLQSAWKVLKQAPLGSSSQNKGHKPVIIHDVETTVTVESVRAEIESSPSPI